MSHYHLQMAPAGLALPCSLGGWVILNLCERPPSALICEGFLGLEVGKEQESFGLSMIAVLHEKGCSEGFAFLACEIRLVVEDTGKPPPSMPLDACLVHHSGTNHHL